MRILAIMRPPEGTDVRAAVMEHASEEMRSLWDLYLSGMVREMYSPGGPGAVLILEADSLDDAGRRLAELPLLSTGVMTLELIEMHPFKALQLLFGE